MITFQVLMGSEPVDTLSFSEGEDGVVNLTHEILLKNSGTVAGNVSKTAFENARTGL